LHGLHSSSIDHLQQINFGARKGLEAARVLDARYWTATHDEVKHGSGIIRWLLNQQRTKVEEALTHGTGRRNRKLHKGVDEVKALEEQEEDRRKSGSLFVEVGDGEKLELVWDR